MKVYRPVSSMDGMAGCEEDQLFALGHQPLGPDRREGEIERTLQSTGTEDEYSGIS